MANTAGEYSPWYRMQILAWKMFFTLYQFVSITRSSLLLSSATNSIQKQFPFFFFFK